ncbi:MAG TPA: DUF5518 domain-containing protein [Methanobacteriaceae archaeon]|nr:DUF5518 domain-containing protein [Methanobacteriaceae archaeon]
MINWGVVIVGFLAEIILGGILGVLIPGWGALLGLLLAGMLVGYMVGGDAGNGAVNGAGAGAFGAIIISVLLLIFGTILLGLVGFAAASVTSMVLLLGSIGVIIIMALGGAVGSLIKGEPEASL